MCRIVLDAAKQLAEETGISCEVIDVQTLLPFDRYHMITQSIKKTSRVLFTDEDVPEARRPLCCSKCWMYRKPGNGWMPLQLP